MISYQSYEFCKATNCPRLPLDDKTVPYCKTYPEFCIKTAKEFHNWLKENNYLIEKETK